MNKLVLIRGLPGSGKTTLAESHYADYIRLEADMYFMNDVDEYVWVASDIGKAHEWCQEECLAALEAGLDVVVSNTFTTMKECRPYLEMWPNVEIRDCSGEFQNVHGVPDDVISRMKQRWISKDDPKFIDYVSQWGVRRLA